ncbi:MAG: aldo/keto reductase [Chitinophagaceae bacterium]|nr:aldo/keto reductase [Chitinophagaceae bacterium]
MDYKPAADRYEQMPYRRCGKSGLKLPALSLGLWHNFGGVDAFETGRAIVRRAFDAGITHFDLANNYGPPPGSAEENFGEWGSRKYLLASLDQSLKRMGIGYVDIFYSHRPDPDTPLEETMMALDTAVRSGRALYAGISSYPPELTRQAAQILQQLGTPCIIHQPRYSMFDRWVEAGLLQVCAENGMGCIAFSPLAQGLLTNRYLQGIPPDSRAAKPHGFLQKDALSTIKLEQIQLLNSLAVERGQSLSQMAIAWLLKDSRVTSVLIGVSSVAQLNDNLNSLAVTTFSTDEINRIEHILAMDPGGH